MVVGVVRSRHHRDREVSGIEEERRGQTAHRTVGQKEKEGGSDSRSVGCCTDNNRTGKGHSSSSSIGGSCEDERGPHDTGVGSRGRRNKRRRHGPTKHMNAAEAPTPSRAGRVALEGQGLKIVY